MIAISTLFKKNINLTITTLFVYVLLALVMIYFPIAINLSDTFLGKGEVVFWSNYFWWFDFSTNNFINPMRHDFIFYPLGLYMTDGIFPMLFFAPLTRCFGPTVSYNIYVISTFALAGLGTYMLSRKLSVSYLPSVMAGIIFAFFPFHFGSAWGGHLHTFSIMWIPFFAITAINFIDRPSLRNTFIAALTFSITALTSWSTAVMAALYFAILLSFNCRTLTKNNFFLKLIAFVCISIFLMIPGLYPLITEIVTGEYSKPLDDFITNSADLLSFITPSPLHPVWGSYFKNINSQFTGNMSENLMYVGISVLILAVIGAIVSKKNIHARVMIFVTLFFIIISLGPFLHIAGSYHFTENNSTVSLPGMWTAFLPVFNMIRVPSRYIIMVMFGLSILAAFGINHISKILSQKFHRFPSLPYAVQTLGCVLVLFEFMTMLPVQAAVKIPDFYYKIGKTKGHSPILTVPINLMGANGRDYNLDGKLMINYYEYQKIHQKPMFGGYWSRVADKYENFLHADPVLRYVYNQKKDIIDYAPINPLIHLKKSYGVSHVVLHKSFMSDSEINAMIAYFGSKYTEDISVEGNHLIVYSTNDATFSSNDLRRSPLSNNITLGSGWHRIDYWKKQNGEPLPTRWMGDAGELIFHSREDQNVSLLFTAYNHKKDQKVAITVTNTNGTQELLTTVITGGSSTLTIPIHLPKGKNVISLKSLDGTYRPCEDPTANSRDCRDLSIAVQNVVITPGTKR